MTANHSLWYQEANEVLQPLRYHLNELILEMESHNRYAARAKQPLLSQDKIAEAKKAQRVAEKFFTRQL